MAFLELLLPAKPRLKRPRAISVQLAPATSGLSRSLADTPTRRSGHVERRSRTDSQADSAGPDQGDSHNEAGTSLADKSFALCQVRPDAGAMHAEVAEVRMLLGSPDARVRALAVRSACPCHGTFELLTNSRTSWHCSPRLIQTRMSGVPPGTLCGRRSNSTSPRRGSCPVSATARRARKAGTAGGPCAATSR
jgi:hypothetical protein